MTKRAAIDIGTNTILLLIADVEGCSIQPLVDEVRVVRLGQGVDSDGVFHPDAMKRAKSCFQEYADLLKKHHVTDCRAAATSGSRDAKNSREFFDEMELILGFEIEVISGEREAELSFNGALCSKENPDNYAIIDIGGGSTEFVCRNSNGDFVRESFDLGCVRMKERFLATDPATDSEVDSVRRYVREVFSKNSSIWSAISQKDLVGVAGTATYLSAANLNLPHFDVEKVDNSVLTLLEIQALAARLTPMTSEERLGIGGMDEGRADVIVGGAVILEEALRAANLSELTISVRGLRFGLVL